MIFWDGKPDRAQLVALDGSPLWRTVLDRSVEEEQAGLASFWSRHRWICSGYTGRGRSIRMVEVCEWCATRLGPQADPYSDRAGRWLMAGATVNGWTWFGFDSPRPMVDFRSMWGSDCD